MPDITATLTLYTVPQGAPGRAQASVTGTVAGQHVRQNLFVYLTDTRVQREPFYHGTVLDTIDFTDTMDVHERVQRMAAEFDGTWSRMSTPHVDNASYRLTDTERLLAYIHNIGKEME